MESTVKKGDNRPSDFEAKSEYWRSILKALGEFTGSQREFCRQHGIASGTLDQWRKRLNNAAGPLDDDHRDEVPLLMPVCLSREDNARQQSHESPAVVEQRIEILLKDGNRVLVPLALPMPLLLDLLSGLPGNRDAF